MRNPIKPICFCMILLLISCKEEKKESATEISQNFSLLDSWKGPYEGVPAFDRMKIDLIEPAIKKGIQTHLDELNKIAKNPENPTFENTIVPMEKSGKALNRAFTYYGIYSSNRSSKEFREVQQKLAPVISEYTSKILQNETLFQRIETIEKEAQKNPLSKEKQRTLNLIYEKYIMNGAALSSEDKKRYTEINKKLSKHYTDFSNNVLADEEKYTVYLSDNELDGLPESYIKSAAKIATDNGKDGKYAVTNTRSSMDPFLTYADNRKLRKKVWRNYYNRANNNDDNDNKKIIQDILKLRHERVQLLGNKNFAQWRLQNRMAKTPKNATKLMKDVWPAAIEKVEEEVADMQAIADNENANLSIKPWDYRYYAEKVRKKKYALDSEEIKQYLVLENLTQALFYTAEKLFGYTFKPVEKNTVPVFHEDVKVWEVHHKYNGKFVGLWYLDPYARKGKRSGAWATTYRSKSELTGNKPVLASNNSNFVKPAPGEPVLISWDDAETFFHEFGHALHFLSANVDFPTLNGGVRDYTEFQSQLLERWLSTDSIINKFLKHHKTEKPIPKELVTKIKKAATFNQGFATTEFLASALMDMKYHTTNPKSIHDIEAFEKQNLDSLEMPKEIVMRHRSTHFGHIFSGEGYAAGYYGYLWAEVLTADAAEAFAEAPDGFYDKDMANKLVKYLFAPRNEIDPAEAYKKFRGKEAQADALMRDRGFE